MSSSSNAPVAVPQRVGLYKMGKELGVGATAVVCEAVHCITGRAVAIKAVPKNRHSVNLISSEIIAREIAIMKLLDHPGILHLYSVEEDAENLYMVMELAPDGQLCDLAEKGVTPEDAHGFFRQIVAAIAYMHSQCVCHHDIKLENILMNGNNIKLADFGMAVVMREGVLLEDFCGSLPYVSPEMVCCEPFDGVKSDAWSLGVLLYTLLTGNLPIGGTNEEMTNQIAHLERVDVPDTPTVSPDARDLLNHLLVRSSERFTTQQILQHPYVAGSVPLPLPTPLSFTTPCLESAAAIDKRVFASLLALGICSEDAQEALQTELLQSKRSQARAYYYLLQRWYAPPVDTRAQTMTRSRAQTLCAGQMPTNLPFRPPFRAPSPSGAIMTAATVPAPAGAAGAGAGAGGAAPKNRLQAIVDAASMRARSNTLSSGKTPLPVVGPAAAAALARGSRLGSKAGGEDDDSDSDSDSDSSSSSSSDSEDEDEDDVVVRGVVDRAGYVDRETVKQRLESFLQSHAASYKKTKYGYLCTVKSKKGECQVVVAVDNHHDSKASRLTVRLALGGGSVGAFGEFCSQYPAHGLFPDSTRKPS